MTTILPKHKGATPTLLARRLGMGRGGSGTAERPVENASDPRQKPGVAERSLRGLRNRGRVVHEHEGDWLLVCGRDYHQRQPVSGVAPHSKTEVFPVVPTQGVGTAESGDSARVEQNNRH
jgi:hypothetical protein